MSSLAHTAPTTNKYHNTYDLFVHIFVKSRHLQTIHPEVYEQLHTADKVKPRQNSSAASTSTKGVLVPVNKTDFEDFLVGMVVEHATPLHVFR